jgi:hypothetical protein
MVKRSIWRAPFAQWSIDSRDLNRQRRFNSFAFSREPKSAFADEQAWHLLRELSANDPQS